MTYYFAVDSHVSYNNVLFTPVPGLGTIVLNWAYKSSGVFRFATEDVDYTTGLPLYQAAETESDYLVHYVPVGNAVLFTYYNYNVPGVLVTVTRVAGSTGRAVVGYKTVDGVSLTNATTGATNYPSNEVGAVAGIDYTPVSGTLVFDDYEMSKTILVPILDPGPFGPVPFGSGGTTNNTFFGVELVDDGGLTSPALDPLESGDVAPPRVDPNFGTALVKILNVNADPYGPDIVPMLVTNPPPPATNGVVSTNNIIAAFPTNPIVSFQKCNFRVPEDVNDPANPNGYTTPVTIYVRAFPLCHQHLRDYLALPHQ